MKELSVLMSIYKNSDPLELEECFNSLERQTVKANEYVLVIDGQIGEQLKEKVELLKATYDKLVVLPLEKNMGLGLALREGMECCSNELIARMDTDDICVKERFEKQIQCFLDDDELSIVGSDIAEFIGDTSNIVGVRAVPQKHEEICEYLKSRCPFNHMTVMFKKSEVIKAGGYLHWHYNEDSYLWLRMYLAGCKFRNIKENLVFARINEATYQRRGGWKYFKSEAKLQKFTYDNKIISLIKFCHNVIIRFILQALMPNSLRAWIFKKFARKKINKEQIKQPS